MRTRRSRAAQAGNLDSLLDTMANVTGILVFMLIVTQVVVGEAVERIGDQLSERPELTPQSLARAEDEASALAEALAPLVSRQEQLEDTRRSGRQQLAALRTNNETTQAAAGAALRFPGDLATLQDALERAERDEQQLAARIGQARREITVLDKQLAAIGTRESQREVVLPDPRPAPRGARQLPVFVRYGRVLPVDVTELVGLLKRGTMLASEGRWIYGDGPPNFVDRSKIVAYFQENDVGTQEFRWHVINNGGLDFWAHLEWRDRDKGDSLAELGSSRSRFRNELTRLNARSHYLLFFVWEDSFEPYLVAREMAAEAGFTSGWSPHGEHVPFRQHLMSTESSVHVD